MAAGPTSPRACSRSPIRRHAAALKAAQTAAAEQKVPGREAVIEFEDKKGKWHTETDRGDDRPSTSVKDTKR